MLLETRIEQLQSFSLCFIEILQCGGVISGDGKLRGANERLKRNNTTGV